MNNMTAEEVAVVQSHLTALRTLEAAVPAAGDNLDIKRAAVWEHNEAEVSDRAGLLDMWSRRLCSFMGVPPGPNYSGAGRTMRLVV